MRLNAIPAALRETGESSRFATDLMKRAMRPMTEARTVAFPKGRLALLPEEPEDAKLTGSTRSLARRLMALNVGGSLRRSIWMPESKIA